MPWIMHIKSPTGLDLAKLWVLWLNVYEIFHCLGLAGTTNDLLQITDVIEVATTSSIDATAVQNNCHRHLDLRHYLPASFHTTLWLRWFFFRSVQLCALYHISSSKNAATVQLSCTMASTWGTVLLGKVSYHVEQITSGWGTPAGCSRERAAAAAKLNCFNISYNVGHL